MEKRVLLGIDPVVDGNICNHNSNVNMRQNARYLVLKEQSIRHYFGKALKRR
jgi:hypothetical protein